MASRKLREWDPCLYSQRPGQFAGNPALYAALLFLSAADDLVPGRGTTAAVSIMEAPATALVDGPRLYGHDRPAQPR